ncbi:MAG: GNAT family N-acyltransferase [Acidobacteriota bacterium]
MTAILQTSRAKSQPDIEITDGRYLVKIAESPGEIESALRLRYQVFSIELGGAPESCEGPRIEFDEFDLSCRHLLVVDRTTSQTVGTYRLNSIENAKCIDGFYSNREFSLEDLPSEVLSGGIEIGRACIAAEHRNTKVLFLLWKGLVAHLQATGKRYFFGCCSIFTDDESVGSSAYRQLFESGHVHENFRVTPRANAVDIDRVAGESIELPGLFNMYLRMGAKVCGAPIVDRDFGTIDFFVVCDTEQIDGKYRKMFFQKTKR